MSPRTPNLEYENAEVKCFALKNIPRLQTPGIEIEIKEGREFTTYFWLARELVSSGLARYSEDALTGQEWTQIHFKERLNPAGPPSALPDDFYPRAYHSFTQTNDKDEPRNIIGRMRTRYREILESRINRISRLATVESSIQIKTLEDEESKLYEALHRLISDYRTSLRSIGEE